MAMAMALACVVLTACSVVERVDGDYDRDHDTHDLWLKPQHCGTATTRLNCFSVALRTFSRHRLELLLAESSYVGTDGQVSPLLALGEPSVVENPLISLQIIEQFFVPAQWYRDLKSPAPLTAARTPLPHARQVVTIAYKVDGQRYLETYDVNLHWALQGPAPCMWQC